MGINSNKPISTGEVLMLRRLINRYSHKEIASWLDLDTKEYLLFEHGIKYPTDKQVTVFANTLDIPKRRFYENRLKNEGYIDKIIKKHLKYEYIIKMLDNNPKVFRKLNKFCREFKSYKNIKADKIIQRVKEKIK